METYKQAKFNASNWPNYQPEKVTIGAFGGTPPVNDNEETIIVEAYITPAKYGLKE